MRTSKTRRPMRHILINRRALQVEAATLTGKGLAQLMGVPADNAVVEREDAGELVFVQPDETIALQDGQSFLVTRQYIMGGCGGLPGLEMLV